jgi:hypothetical protein
MKFTRDRDSTSLEDRFVRISAHPKANFCVETHPASGRRATFHFSSMSRLLSPLAQSRSSTPPPRFRSPEHAATRVARRCRLRRLPLLEHAPAPLAWRLESPEHVAFSGLESSSMLSPQSLCLLRWGVCWSEGRNVTLRSKSPLLSRCSDRQSSQGHHSPDRHQTKTGDEGISQCGLVQLRGPRAIRPIVTGPAWPPRVTGLICKGIPVITVCNPALWEYSGDNLGSWWHMRP